MPSVNGGYSVRRSAFSEPDGVAAQWAGGSTNDHFGEDWDQDRRCRVPLRAGGDTRTVGL